MTKGSPAMPSREAISRVTLYKRDELTTDLICCSVEEGNHCSIFHEDLSSWNELLHVLATLPGFRSEWIEQVMQPPFATSAFVAFERT